MIRIAAALLVACLSLPAATHYVTVAGLGGEPEYDQRFQSLAREIDKLLKATNVPGTTVATLAGEGASKAKLQSALQQVAQAASPQDEFVLMLIGHGTFDGQEYRLNLPGPDMTAGELAAALARIRTGRQLVVNTTSSSGGALAALQSPNRTVIAATRAGSEKNATVFARYWVEALRDPSADTDKNEVVTALEAFRFADLKTKQFYDAQKRLATEHAVLNDTGRGEAVRAPSNDNGQGVIAGRFPLLRLGSVQAASRSPEKQKLLTRREELERQIDQLKVRKAAMASDDYRLQLHEALLELARIQAEIDK